MNTGGNKNRNRKIVYALSATRCFLFTRTKFHRLMENQYAIRKEQGLAEIPYSSDAYQEDFDEEKDYIDWDRKPRTIKLDKD